MAAVEEGTLLWEPSEEVRRQANLTHYIKWLGEAYGLRFDNYEELWQWSVADLEQFWQSIWDYFDIEASQEASEVLAEDVMPGAVWFPGARLNYAENIFAKMSSEKPVVYFKSEEGALQPLSRADLWRDTVALAAALRQMGVGRGDRVVAFLPNIPQAIVGLLATASIGGIWSSCSPEFGARSVLDRFTQIEPRVLLACDGYRYNGKAYERLDVVATLQESLPTLQETILVPLLGVAPTGPALQHTINWRDALAEADGASTLHFEQVAFDHPLWVLYSSGTTGLPKPIVHGHGGVLLEHAKETVLHMDLKPADRFFWHTSTGWMMWNYLVGGLLSGASIVVYDGSPNYPDLYALWELVAESAVTYFGTSAAFIHACMKAGLRPAERYDLHELRAIGSTGSPLSPSGFAWVYDHVGSHLALESFSGGTDLCTGFVGGVRTQPIYAGEIQARSLGASIRAFDRQGRARTGEVGELVITRPMPSMPLYFWGDEANRRYKQSYFDVYPGVWRHGDWIKITEHGGCVIYGRSDATINRQGVRMGTAEIYRVVESLPEISDALVVDTERLDGEPYMALFVVLNEPHKLDDDLKKRIAQRLRQDLSPRHVPDDIVAVAQIPYTLSGKKMEIPVREILLGGDTEKAVNRGAMRNPQALDFFVDFAERRKE
ncbi:MAG TPA: acetoacetate--CoA ligase [Candidatus Binatia bacterium]|nr:acetoacetate--CoA ligase [Candidatus Binatia bacterium]